MFWLLSQLSNSAYNIRTQNWGNLCTKSHFAPECYIFTSALQNNSPFSCQHVSLANEMKLLVFSIRPLWMLVRTCACRFCSLRGVWLPLPAAFSLSSSFSGPEPSCGGASLSALCSTAESGAAGPDDSRFWRRRLSRTWQVKRTWQDESNNKNKSQTFLWYRWLFSCQFPSVNLWVQIKLQVNSEEWTLEK